MVTISDFGSAGSHCPNRNGASLHGASGHPDMIAKLFKKGVNPPNHACIYTSNVQATPAVCCEFPELSCCRLLSRHLQQRYDTIALSDAVATSAPSFRMEATLYHWPSFWDPLPHLLYRSSIFAILYTGH